MTKFNDKTNNVDQVDDVAYNNLVRAARNSILSSGQAISNVDNTQVAKSQANYAGVSTFYTDAGAANAYVLSPIDSFEAPHAYIDGMEIRFRPGNNNTGASTVNVNSLGVKTIKRKDGVTDLISGDVTILDDVRLRYDTLNDVFILTEFVLPASLKATNGYSFSFNNTLFQWGNTPSIAPVSSLVVNFPITFPNAVFSIILTATSLTTNGQAANFISGKTTSQFTLNNQGVIGNITFNWLAIGH